MTMESPSISRNQYITRKVTKKVGTEEYGGQNIMLQQILEAYR
jgi:hypothetical protein